MKLSIFYLSIFLKYLKHLRENKRLLVAGLIHVHKSACI